MALHSILRWGLWSSLSALGLWAALCYLNFPLGYNQNIYHYMGMVLKNGGAPYRDFVDRKGPVAFLGCSLAAILFGLSDRAYRFFDLLVLLAIGLCLYQWARKSLRPQLAAVVAVLWFLHVMVDGPDNTGDVMNLIVLGVVAVALLLDKKTAARLFALGSLTAAVSWVKPTALIIVAPLLGYHLLFVKNERGETGLGKSLGMVLFGFVSCSGLVVAYLYFTKSLAVFYETVIFDSLTFYVPRTQFDINRNWNAFSDWLHEDLIFRSGGFLGLFLGGLKDRMLGIARLAVVGGLLAILVESQFWQYHFTPLLPFLAFVIVAGLKRLTEVLFPEGRSGAVIRKAFPIQGLVIALVVWPFFWPPLRFLAKEWRIIRSSPYGSIARAELMVLPDVAEMYRNRLQVTQTLQRLMKPADTVYMLGSDMGIYLALRKQTACRHGNSGDVLLDYNDQNSLEHRRKWRAEILAFLQRDPPNWLLVERNLEEHMDEETKLFIQDLTQRSYREPMEVGSYRLYPMRGGS